MKKIFQTLFIMLTVGFSLSSCYDYYEAMNSIPKQNAPTIKSVTQSSAVFNEYSYYSYGTYYHLYVSENQDMSNAVECETVKREYSEYNYNTHKYETESYYEGVAYNLQPNTTYYAQLTQEQKCDNGGAVVKSPLTEFKTPAYDPTSYIINLATVPGELNYGVFTVDANGVANYESVKYGSALYPSTRISDNSTVYVTYPSVSGTSDPQAVRIYKGTDFYYASGTVNPVSPNLTLAPKRYTVDVNTVVTFKAQKEDADNVKLTGVTIANVDGNTPICSDGLLNLVTGEFTPSESAGSYNNNTSTSISSGKAVSRMFYGVLPVKFGDNAVKVVLSLSGDIKDKEVSVVIPADTWAPGSDVKINLNAEYTVTGVELTVTNVNVTPWSDGSTGNIDITK